LFIHQHHPPHLALHHQIHPQLTTRSPPSSHAKLDSSPSSSSSSSKLSWCSTKGLWCDRPPAVATPPPQPFMDNYTRSHRKWREVNAAVRGSRLMMNNKETFVRCCLCKSGPTATCVRWWLFFCCWNRSKWLNFLFLEFLTEVSLSDLSV
jgi:hypothetical protein